MGADVRIGVVRCRFSGRRGILRPDCLAREGGLAGLELDIAEARRTFGAEVGRGRTDAGQSPPSRRAASVPWHGGASAGPVLADGADRRWKDPVVARLRAGTCASAWAAPGDL